MGVRSALSSTLTRAAKAIGGPQDAALTLPQEMREAARDVSQMGPQQPFSPGEPIAPYDGYGRQPRQHNFPTSYNVATRPRTHERVSFETLKGLVEAYDVAQVAIWHRIDSLRSLDWQLMAADGYNGDVSDAMALGMAALEKPDHENAFSTWLAKWLYDVLAYDAGALYRMRNRAGRVVGLSPVDGTSVAPLLDYWGNSPKEPAEAYVQYANGLPWNWLTRGDLIYEPFRPRTNSPYGNAPLESIILNANTDIRFQVYFLERFCYDDQTEILTGDGWKRFPDVRGDEEFATRSVAGEFEWQASNDGKLHEFDSGGTMVEFRNRDVDLLVTPNHRMLTRRKPQGEMLLLTDRDWEYEWHIRRADEFLSRCTVDWRLPLTSSWTAPLAYPERFTRSVPGRKGRTGGSPTTRVDMPMWAFARFLGIYIAEGNLRYTPSGQHDRWEISVAQMEGGKLDEVRKILKDTGLNWSYYSDAHTGRFTVGCKALWTYLEQCGRGAWNKVLPGEVMDWPAELLEHLMYGLMTGDGSLNPSGLATYITTSARLADQVQEIWQKCGMYSSVATKQPHPTSFSKRVQYHVRSRRESEFQMPIPAAVPYDGRVYCVSVPNGIVLVRRNGKTMWCGNTAGNVPEALASAPETWTPEQVEQWQAIWDTTMYGDQSRKHQIKWLPGGSSFTWSNEKPFSDQFSLFLMRKSLAAYHVVPADVGFTENVNRSSGESQADVAHKVGEKPFGRYVEGIISRWLKNDLRLPLKFGFDWGEEQDDRLQQAQADDIYIKNGTVGASEIREERFGLPEPEGKPVPRYIFTERGGPVPLAALYGLSGDIDPETSAPVPGSELPHMAFGGVEGVQPTPPMQTAPLAVQEFGPAALPPAPPQQPGTVAKEDGGGSTVGITSETGITSYDLIGRDEDEDEDRTGAERTAVAKAEMAAFRSFRQKRRRAGDWRDFEFRAVDPVTGHNLNDAGRLAIRKAAGEVAVAGLAVQAADTGRVLMLQRALTPDDPAGGTWEFPGGHMEEGETPLQAAWREWAEETGCIPPPGQQGGTWIAGEGIYQGTVWTVPSEDCVPVRSESQITNPDDPDGDQIEAIAWWDPAALAGNPAVRPALAASLDDVLPLLTPAPCCGGECCADGCCGGSAGCQCGTGPVAKAADPPGPKAGEVPAWPGWRLSDHAAAYWAPLVTTAATEALSAPLLDRMATAYLDAHPDQDGSAAGKQDRNEAAYAWLVAWLAAAGVSLDFAALAAGILTDGYLIGAASAAAVVAGTGADLGGWQPGGMPAAEARTVDLGARDALAALLAAQGAASAAAISGGFLGALSRTLAGADGDTDRGALAAALVAAVAGAALAVGLVLGRLYAAAGNGALDYYGANVTGDFQWVTDPTLKNCAICLGNEAGDPRPLGEPWPSGDEDVNIHEKCGCMLVPA